MRFGCRCQAEQMTPLAEAGYDFAEGDIGMLYPGLSDADFRRARLELLGEPLFPEVIRAPELSLWAGRWLAGNEDTPLAPRDFFRRAALVGCKVVLAPAPRYESLHRFNGTAEAWRQATAAAGILGEHAGRAGVQVALEPAPEDAGPAGTVEEAWVLAEELGHRSVGVSLDIARVADLADAGAADSALKHVSLPLPRRYGGQYDTTTCLEALDHLAEYGYAGRVTVAAGWADLADRAEDLLEELKRHTA